MSVEFPGNNPDRRKAPERLRISVSNLVNSVRVRETGERLTIVMRNKKAWEQGVRKYQAIGGAAKMTPDGKDLLTAKFNAEFGAPGRPEEESDDARFFLNSPATEEDAVAEVLDLFSAQNPEIFEEDVLREAHEDLVGDGALTEEEFREITATYKGSVSPIDWQTKTSEREAAGIPSRRIFHLFELEVPEHLKPKLAQAETLRILSDSDIADIQAATQAGNPAAVMKDGAIIVENIFPTKS